jgi:hypothetical protein
MGAMLTDIQAREALHVLVLMRAGEVLKHGAFILKGGVNLRLFFGSRRYSEDVDVDLDRATRSAFVNTVNETLRSRWLLDRLAMLGIERLEFSGRPAKNTDTTVRFKLGVVNAGGIRLPTRLEASLRERAASDAAVVEEVDPTVTARYLNPADRGLVVSHYPLQPALRQKIQALATRRLAQARDVFDLPVLAKSDRSNADVTWLRHTLSTDVLREAARRTWEIGYEQFRDQVLEFLADEDQHALGNEEEWERRQLFVVELIETILQAPEASQ